MPPFLKTYPSLSVEVAASPARVASFTQGLTEGCYEQGPRGEEVWLPREELVLCEGCFEDSYACMVSNIKKMSRGEIRFRLGAVTVRPVPHR